MKRKMISPRHSDQDQPIVLRLTQSEIDLIRDETLYDPDFGQIAETQGSKRLIPITLDELEDLLGYIAAEANHAEDKTLERKLDRLYEKLDMIRERHQERNE
jgi:hypothetical protein